MTVEKTNAQEREALQKIKEILKDFDPKETYVGKAFEGCVELAKENIDNDWLYSWKGRYENRDRDAAKLDEILTKTTDKLRKSEEARVDLVKELNQKDDTIARYIDVVQGKDREISRLKKVGDETYKNLEDKLEEEHQKLEKSQAEIIRLKAKLYDMMTAGEEVKK